MKIILFILTFKDELNPSTSILFALYARLKLGKSFIFLIFFYLLYFYKHLNLFKKNEV